MKHKDKIPRTPIDPELLAQIHQQNVSLIGLKLISFVAEIVNGLWNCKVN